jgi:phage head maturation protease
MSTEVNEWKFDPSELMKSKRKITGTFHKAVIDKDGEYITPDAIRKSIPDYMHLPALHDFHKERPVGIATRIWEQSDGSFGFEGVIKATEDCDDVWEKIQKGNYDHVSIFGRRTEGNSNCSLPQGLRTGPCITNGVRLDSISVCDDNARNDFTSLAVKKAQLIWDADIMKAEIEKAMPDIPERSNPRAKEKPKGKFDSMGRGYVPPKEEKKAETAESSNLMHTATDDPEKKCPCKKGTKYKVIEKGDEDDEMTDDVEKGAWEGGEIGELRTKDTHKTKKPSHPKEKKREETSGVKYDKMEKSDDEDVEKGEKEQEIDTETRGKDAKEEPSENKEDEQEEEEEGVKKGIRIVDADKDDKKTYAEHRKDEKPSKKQPKFAEPIKKGEPMDEKEEKSQEYVTKAMVPIEEVDTIVKARTEEITKAYTAQFDEIKKANLAAIEEVKKAYDTKFSELSERVDKMSEETIRKGGSIVVIPQLLDPGNTGVITSNAEALAKLQAGK